MIEAATTAMTHHTQMNEAKVQQYSAKYVQILVPPSLLAVTLVIIDLGGLPTIVSSVGGGASVPQSSL